MRNNKQKLIIVIALVMAVFGLSIGFAVFSSTLNIQSRASVNPTNNFNVKFASSISTTDQGITYQDDTSNYPVSKSVTGSSTASNATIDNTLEYPTISNLNATFTEPGESVQYTFYVVNVGEYDAYLTNLVFNNAPGSNQFKDCVANASSDNPASNASSVCNNINLSVKLGNENPVQATTTFNNHLLEKNNFETVIVTISYTGEIYADGAINVSFGDINLHYSTIDEPIAIATQDINPWLTRGMNPEYMTFDKRYVAEGTPIMPLSYILLDSNGGWDTAGEISTKEDLDRIIVYNSEDISYETEGDIKAIFVGENYVILYQEDGNIAFEVDKQNKNIMTTYMSTSTSDFTLNDIKANDIMANLATNQGKSYRYMLSQ